MSESEPSRPRGRHWLSVGFGDLAVRISEKADAVERDFDVLIIGSGYGGSIAAHQLANYAEGGRPLSIGILERGQEYTEGEFPAEPGDLPPHVRFAFSESERAMGVLDGLFDFRFGPDVASLVGNGLGGGSLINAGVMIRPLQKVFNGDWPANLRGGELSDAFDACRRNFMR